MTSRVIAVLLCCSLLTGCIAGLQGPCSGKPLPQLLDATDLKPLFLDMARELCMDQPGGGSGKEQACRHDATGRQTVLVTDFVDLRTLVPEQSGLLMGELMRGSLNQACCYGIVQAEFGKHFKLSDSGLISLTRRVKEIGKDDYMQPEAIVGTYSHLNNGKVLLFVRRIDTASGHVVKMVTRELDYACGGRLITYGVR
ncbi:FlgO family outer membrane protein [Trichlorobacter ammonificans]|uniref:FlgO domain-containing protein n=1 Tax=Trichlorobacter ammonificans TaxID=2916410 RepID=A0ABM9DBL9_9BACT|nr:FlgO family outer membrane protein [Trichlorobacter ammonificans]CAH2032627.1 FlgO domain-containing protein [Trichlorobacter ammonificans]